MNIKLVIAIAIASLVSGGVIGAKVTAIKIQETISASQNTNPCTANSDKSLKSSEQQMENTSTKTYSPMPETQN